MPYKIMMPQNPITHHSCVHVCAYMLSHANDACMHGQRFLPNGIDQAIAETICVELIWSATFCQPGRSQCLLAGYMLYDNALFISLLMLI